MLAFATPAAAPEEFAPRQFGSGSSRGDAAAVSVLLLVVEEVVLVVLVVLVLVLVVVVVVVRRPFNYTAAAVAATAAAAAAAFSLHERRGVEKVYGRPHSNCTGPNLRLRRGLSQQRLHARVCAGVVIAFDRRSAAVPFRRRRQCGTV